MNSVKVIIQSTKTDRGLEIEYNSFDSSFSLNELKESLIDERDIPSKANDKDALCVEISGAFRIYSLIIGILDIEGRPGYFAIKLFCRKNRIIQNFESILYQLKSKYEANQKSGNFHNSNYTDIISAAVEESNNQNPLVLQQQGKYFCYYEKETQQLERYFNSDIIYLVEKLYAFQKPLQQENERGNLKLIQTLEQKVSRTKITGDLNLVNEVKINKQQIDFDPNQNSIVVLLLDNENMNYQISSKAETRKIGDEIQVFKKYVEPKKPKTAEKSYLGFLLGCLLGLIIGVGFGYFLLPDFINEPLALPTIDMSGQTITPDSVIFERNGNKFTTVHQAFKDYSFKYTDGKWSFSSEKSEGNFTNFYRSSIDSIIYEGKTLTEDLKKEFFASLEKIAEQKVLDKEKTDQGSKKTEAKADANKEVEPESKPETKTQAKPADNSAKKAEVKRGGNEDDKKESGKPKGPLEVEDLKVPGSKKKS